MSMGQRRKSRELALQILFQEEFQSNLNPEQALALYRESFDSSPELWEYAKRIVKGVNDNKESIDKLLESNIRHWKLDRVAHVDRNILRIAVYEIKHMADEIPNNVAINEALEVAKKFASTDSSSFINGVLDNIAKSK